jgi:hypothetical protein
VNKLVSDNFTVPLDHIGKSTTAAIPIAEDHSPSVENMCSHDEVSPGLCTGSDYRIPLDRLIKTSTTPRSQFAEGNAPSNDSELGRDEVPLDLCSSRSAIVATLGPLSPRSFVTDELDGVLEFGPCRSVAPQTQDGDMRRVRVRASPFRRVEVLPPPMNFEEQMIEQCKCTGEDNVDDESDGPPGLEGTSDVDEQSQGERDEDAPLGPSQNTTAQDFVRETLLPTSLEVTAMKLMRDVRIQHQATVDHSQRRTGSAIGGLCTLLPVRRPGLSAMRRPEEWIELEVTVDSGACISVMPITSCEGIDIEEN